MLTGRDISAGEAARLCDEGLLVRAVCDVVTPVDARLDDAGRAGCVALLTLRDGVDMDVWVVGLEAALWVHTGFPARSAVLEHIDLLGPRGRAPRYQSPIVHRQCRLAPGEVQLISGIRVTSPARTGADLARILPGILALRALERLREAAGTTPESVNDCLALQGGARGVAQGRRTVRAWLAR